MLSFVLCSIVSIATWLEASSDAPAWAHWVQIALMGWCWYSHGQGRLRLIEREERRRRMHAIIKCGPSIAEMDRVFDELLTAMANYNRRMPDGKRIQA